MTKQREPVAWITSKGARIPIFEGETVEQAFARRFGTSHKKRQETAGKAPEPQFKSEQEAFEYYQKKFSECSSTYRNKVAHHLNVEGRGQEKINALAKIYAQRWSQNNQINKDADLKDAQIAKNAEEAEAAKKQTTPEKPLADPLDGTLGNREKVDDVVNKINDLYSANVINPHYNDRNQPKGHNYHNNCALCTTATVLQTMGYDVEAGLQPKNSHYDLCELVNIDVSNPDNYLLASNTSGHFAEQYNLTTAIEKEVTRKYKETHGEITRPADYWSSTPEALEARRKYREQQEAIKTAVDEEIKRRSVPRGAPAVAKAVCDKITKWGRGGVGEICVSWAKTTSSHSMVAYYDGQQPVIYCSQSNKRYVGQQAITLLLQGTKANSTLLVRYDNTSFKTNENGKVLDSVKDKISKMVKKRGGAI